MIKGLSRTETWEVLIKELDLLSEASRARREEEEKFAYSGAMAAVQELLVNIDQRLIGRIARSEEGETILHIDPRILNCSAVGEKLLPTLRRDFPAFCWSFGKEENTLHCQINPPSFLYIIGRHLQEKWEKRKNGEIA